MDSKGKVHIVQIAGFDKPASSLSDLLGLLEAELNGSGNFLLPILEDFSGTQEGTGMGIVATGMTDTLVF